MTTQGSDIDVMGPVDYLVVQFPAEQANFSGEAAELDEADESMVGGLLTPRVRPRR